MVTASDDSPLPPADLELGTPIAIWRGRRFGYLDEAVGQGWYYQRSRHRQRLVRIADVTRVSFRTQQAGSYFQIHAPKPVVLRNENLLGRGPLLEELVRQLESSPATMDEYALAHLGRLVSRPVRGFPLDRMPLDLGPNGRPRFDLANRVMMVLGAVFVPLLLLVAVINPGWSSVFAVICAAVAAMAAWGPAVVLRHWERQELRRRSPHPK